MTDKKKSLLNKKIILFKLFLCTSLLITPIKSQEILNTINQSKTPPELYNQIQEELATGWNTWDTRSVLTHVYLPYGFAVKLNMISSDGNRADKFLIGDRTEGAPILHPWQHSYDGTYTEIDVKWNGHNFKVRSAAEGKKNIILVTPLEGNKKGGYLTVEPKTLWKRENKFSIKNKNFKMFSGDSSFEISVSLEGEFINQKENEIIFSIDKPIAICCGEKIPIEDAESFVELKAASYNKNAKKKYGNSFECFNAMQSVLGWDNIYDPEIRKVITPVSRIWNINWAADKDADYGGFVLFCWDNYFASMMLAVGNKQLAYANAVEITNAITENGFVPNFFASGDYKSRDRSQPPVGSLAVWKIYMQYKDKWFLELLYNKLLSWNRWWDKNRNINGLLCWGSNPYDKVTYRLWEYGVNQHYPAVLESGLDNSHMYDDVPFDTGKHMLLLNDVGLSSLYIMDCEYLAKIAEELGYEDDEAELKNRGEKYRKNMNSLWDEENGLFYNRFTTDGTFSRRISPTNFYALLAKAATQQQAERMMNEHFMNPEEFWGDYIIPSTPRNDPAFNDNTYWRGRIWASLNFLVYMGMCNYDLPYERKALAEKSKTLLMKSWLSNGYIYENYNATTGAGDDVSNSDKFYHWGALLGYIDLIENGFVK